MDRTAWIAVSLCVIALVAWEVYVARQVQPRPVQQTFLSSPVASVAPVAVASPAAIEGSNPTPPGPTPAVNFAEHTETLSNNDVELRLTNRGGAISEILLLNHTAEIDQRVVLNAGQRVPIGAIVTDPSSAELPEFTTVPSANGLVQFHRTTPENVEIRKTFGFVPTTEKKDNFSYDMDVEFRNAGTAVYNQSPYFVTLGAAKPVHPTDVSSYTNLAWCVDGKAGSIDVNWFAASNGLFGLQKRPAREVYQGKVANAEWAGVTNQFFATLLVPTNAKAEEVWGTRRELHQPDGTSLPAVEGALRMPGFALQPGQTASVHFQIFGGPKLYHRLAQLGHNEAEVMNFGILKLVSQALLNFMNLLHHYLGSYAAAVIALTTIVNLALWPLRTKGNNSMRRMSALSPKMQELKVKYKDDPQRMNQEVMKMYKQYGVNPVGGCLPMLIQIPIFWGLFTMLRQAVELRNATFFWVKDLSQPDTIAHLPIMNWPVNILPLIMAATSFWMTRLTPKTGDPTQQRLMMFTPLIFVFFCYNFAAALALYYTTQNLFMIMQLYQSRKQPVPVLEKQSAPGKKSSGKRR